MRNTAACEEKNLVLIVEDEEDIAELIVESLVPFQQSLRIVCQCTHSGEEALLIHKKQSPLLVILDLQLPDLDGLSICSRIKKRDDELGASTAVIILTARNTEKDMILGYDLGVDDYITKPFSPRVFSAKIKSIIGKALRLRRSADHNYTHWSKEHDAYAVQQTAGLYYGDIVLNEEMKTLHINAHKQFVSFIEWHILKLLVQYPDRVFSRVEIINAVKGKNHPVTLRSVDVQIHALRKKLEKSAEVRIKTMRSMGYKLTRNNA